MLKGMKARKNQFVCLLAGVVVCSAAQMARADSKPNPYQAIIERNPFGLKPPPPPPDNTPPPPIVPLAKVVLTGITSMFGPTPRALLEITEQEAGKTATVRKPILREGDRDGSVEVISIDVEKSVVKIRNSGVETNILFETPKLPGGGAPPPAFPGIAPAGFPAPATGFTPVNQATNNQGRGGISMFGNSVAPSSAPARGVVPTYGPAGTTFTNNPGFRSIPSRMLRSDGSAPPVPPLPR